MDPGFLLAEEMRALISTLVLSRPSEEQLDSLRDSVATMQETLHTDAPDSQLRYWERGEAGAGYLRDSPYRGTHNPLAPPLNIRAFEMSDSDVDQPTAMARARVTVAPTYEGPPESVHGGMIAAMFDEVMSAAQAARSGHRAGVTAKLEVKYRGLTPSGVPLDLVAWVESSTSRRCTVRAECFDGDRRTAEAQALFLTVPTAATVPDPATPTPNPTMTRGDQ